MPNEPADADLLFEQTHAPVGFTNSELSGFDGSPEPVVRELLQNSVDAADKAGRDRCEVRFILHDVPTGQLPGWDSYWKKFKAAKRYRDTRGTEPTPDESTIIRRIEEEASDRSIPLLVCLDNGIGLDPRRMGAVLTSGNSDKGSGGAGSFGLGHYTAFSASSLRYVLYASKYRDGDGRERELASGHAILATHTETDGQGLERYIAHDGYLASSGQQRMMFGGQHQSYLEQAPALLKRYLTEIVDTGAAVCVAGFNDFLREDGDPAVPDAIATVAAANFVDAIHRGQLVVTVERINRDSTVDVLKTVDSESMGEVLEQIKSEKRAKAGFIRGWDAHRAWCALKNDRNRLVSRPDGSYMDGVRYSWHAPEGSNVPATRVFLFRKGMWITSRAPRLLAGDFHRQPRFDAVVSLTDGDLENLVRSAEGPEHRGLEPKRLSTRDERRQMRDLLEEVAESLRREIGEQELDKEFTPLDFMVLRGEVATSLTPVTPRRRPKVDPDTDRPDAVKNKSGKGKSQHSSGRRRPGSGRPPRYSSALSVTSGSVDAIVDLSLEPEGARYVGVRLTTANGSDETCESPLPTSYVGIQSITRQMDGVTETFGPQPDGEVLLPAFSGRQRLEVTLEQPVNDVNNLELDLVKRQAPKIAKEGA